MKKIVILLVSLFLIFAALQAQDDESERTVVTLSKPGQPVSLEASLLNGSIRVSGYEGKEVIVTAKQRGKVYSGGLDKLDEVVAKALESTGEALKGLSEEREEVKKKRDRTGMKRIGSGMGSGLSVSEKDNHISVELESFWASIDLDIQVPFTTSVKLETVNGGSLIVTGLTGRHELTHVNGNIKMSQISGSALVSTTNGDIVADFKRVDPNEGMGFTTFNGDLDVTFPSNLKAEVRFTTDRGEIYSDFDIDSHKVTDSKVEDKRSSGGRYEVRFEKAIQGAINGGGQKLSFKTFNGDILIRKSK